MRKVTLESSKRDFGTAGNVRTVSSCDTKVVYKLRDGVETHNNDPILWCPSCCKKHRFMVAEKEEV
jgi:hypothetical protein